MSAVKTLSPLTRERLAPRTISGWAPRPLGAILRRAVGRGGLRRSATVTGPTVDAEAEKKRKAQAEAMEKELACVLDAGQVKRFKQLILQTYVRVDRGAGFTVPPAFRNRTLARLVEVRQGLKLSEEQQRKLQDGTEAEAVVRPAVRGAHRPVPARGRRSRGP